MRLVRWQPRRKGSLVGFADVWLPPPIDLTIFDCPVLETNGRRWAALPGKPQIENSRHRIVDGKPAYARVVEWHSRKLSDAFSDRVVALVLAHDPAAFMAEGA